MVNRNLTKRLGTRKKAFIALAVVSILWGTTWVASKQGVMHMPALQLAGFRQLLAGSIYILYFIIKGAKWPRGREWYTIGVLSFLNILCSNGLTTWGVQYISAGLGAIIAATFPLWMVVIGMFTSKDRIPLAALKGFLLGFGGICVIFYEHLHDFFNHEFLFGISISVTAAWTWALGTVFTKKEAREFNPYFSLGIQMFMAGAVLLATSYLSGTAIPVREIPWQGWTAILYLVLFGSVVAFVAYIYALQHLPVEQMSIYAYINPIVAVVLGVLLFNENLTIYMVTGGAITLYGVYMINSALRASNLMPRHNKRPSKRYHA
jgi:drug/metabolite transporter (DMT)-like permease